MFLIEQLLKSFSEGFNFSTESNELHLLLRRMLFVQLWFCEKESVNSAIFML